MREHMPLLISVCLVSFFSAFMGAGLNIALPFISEDYGCGTDDAAWMINAFTVTSAAFLPAAGALADRYGYLRVFRVGAVLTAALSFATAQAADIVTGSTLRALQGVFTALLFCTCNALIAGKLPEEDRTFAIGYSGAAVYAGLSFAPVVTGIAAETLGWEVIFDVTGVFLAVSFLLSFKERGDIRYTDGMPKWRMTLSVAATAPVLLALSLLSEGAAAFVALAAGLLICAAYVIFEYRSEKPLLPVRYIAGNPVFSVALGASFFHYMASFGYILLTAMHLQFNLGYNAAAAGAVVSIQPLLMAVLSSNTGRISRHVSVHAMTVSGVALCLLSVLILVMADLHDRLWPVIISQVLMGCGFGLFSSPNTVIVMNAVERKHFAMASSVLSLSRTAGQGASMAVLTAIMHYTLTSSAAGGASGEEVYLTVKFALSVSAVLFVAALFFATKNRRRAASGHAG